MQQTFSNMSLWLPTKSTNFGNHQWLSCSPLLLFLLSPRHPLLNNSTQDRKPRNKLEKLSQNLSQGLHKGASKVHPRELAYPLRIAVAMQNRSLIAIPLMNYLQLATKHSAIHNLHIRQISWWSPKLVHAPPLNIQPHGSSVKRLLEEWYSLCKTLIQEERLLGLASNLSIIV